MNIDPHSAPAHAFNEASAPPSRRLAPIEVFAATSPSAHALARVLERAFDQHNDCIDIRDHDPDVLAGLPDSTLTVLGPQLLRLRLPAGCAVEEINRWLRHAPALRTLELPEMPVRVHGEPAIDLTPAAQLTWVVTPAVRADGFINPRQVVLGPDLATRQQAVLAHGPGRGGPVRSGVRVGSAGAPFAEPDLAGPPSITAPSTRVSRVSLQVATHGFESSAPPATPPADVRTDATSRTVAAPADAVLRACTQAPGAVVAPPPPPRPTRGRPERVPPAHLPFLHRRRLKDIPAVRAQLLAWLGTGPNRPGSQRPHRTAHDDGHLAPADVQRLAGSVPEAWLPFHARDRVAAARSDLWSYASVPAPQDLRRALTALQHLEDLTTVHTPDGPRLRTEAELEVVRALRDWVTEVHDPQRLLMRDDVADQLIRLWSDQRPQAGGELRCLSGAGPAELPPAHLLLTLGPRAAPIRLVLDRTVAADPAAFRASVAALPIDTLALRQMPVTPLRTDAQPRQPTDAMDGAQDSAQDGAPTSAAASLVPHSRSGALMQGWLMSSLDLSLAEGPLHPPAVGALTALLPRLRQVLLPPDWPHHAQARAARPTAAPLRRALVPDGLAVLAALAVPAAAGHPGVALAPGAPTQQAMKRLMDALSDARLRQAATLDLSDFDAAVISALPEQARRVVGPTLRHLSLPPGMSPAALHDWLRACRRLKRLDAPDIRADPQHLLDLGAGPADLTLHTSPGWLPPMARSHRPPPQALLDEHLPPIHLNLDHDGPLPARLQDLDTRAPMRPFARPSLDALTELRDLLSGRRLTPSSLAPLALGDLSEAFRIRQCLHGLPHALLPAAMRPLLADLAGLPADPLLADRHRPMVTPWLGASLSGDVELLLGEVDRALTRRTPEGRREKTDEELALRTALMRWAEPQGDLPEQPALRAHVVARLMRHWESLAGGPILLTDDVPGPVGPHGPSMPLMELPPRPLLRALGFSAEARQGPPIDLHLRQPGPLDDADFLERSAELPFRRVTLSCLPEGRAPMAWLPRSTQILDLVQVREPLQLTSWIAAVANLPRLSRIEMKADQWTTLCVQQAGLDDPSLADALLLRAATPKLRRDRPNALERIASGQVTLNLDELPREMRGPLTRPVTALLAADARSAQPQPDGPGAVH